MTPPSAGEYQTAGDAFVQWASPQTGAPREVRSLVERVDVAHDHAGLIETELRGRRVTWKSAPVSGKALITLPAVAAEEVDPWEADPPSLRARSDHVAVCDACAGVGKLRCALCSAIGKQRCASCGGQRKAYGRAANGARRLLNCQACRGKGAIDCAGCRRGVAVCTLCAGEGRVQRWLELEWWRRSVSTVHPRTFASRFGWPEDPANEIVEADAHVIADLDRPHALVAADLGDIPLQWLEVLAPQLAAEERVERQRLRIARLSTYTVHYRLGDAEDRVAFAGRRCAAPSEAVAALFVQRASKLRSLLVILLAVNGAIALLSLGRGAFFWSLATLASLIAFGAASICLYRAAAEWTASRLDVQKWLRAAAASLAVAVVFAFIALPRAGHADDLVAAGKLDEAELELQALDGRADAQSWARLRVARIRQVTDVETARKELAQIPRDLPQHAAATDAVDRLILTRAREAAAVERLVDASAVLGQLSSRAHGKPEAIAASVAVYIPLARQRIARTHWSEAADSIVAAQHLGASSSQWKPLTNAIHAAGLSAAASAKRERDVRSRFWQSLVAEEILVSWERTADRWGTPSLIALRTAMARDLAALERSQRRNR